VTEATTTLALAPADPAAFADGLGLLAELTPRLTGEFAIRRFLAADLGGALDVITTWTNHPDPHVRRLASEGTRPYLPWAVRVPALLARPDATVPILDALHRDDSEYVRRSVANHLNDLSRHAPDLVVERAKAWTDGSDVPWGVRHGTRTLVKKGHPATLALLGFAPVAVTVTDLELDTNDVTLPGAVGLTASIRNDGPEPARLAIDYVVHYVKADGRLAPKVFKLTTRTLDPGESVTVATRHALRQMTTRVHHPGQHAVELQVNGQRYGHATFWVRTRP
jgi:3-methyladenine DNA glycosylase AlkC